MAAALPPIAPEALTWRFSRASGPGGQHVNTSSTRVELDCDIAAAGFPAALTERLIARLGPVAAPYMGGVYLRALPWPLVQLTWRLNGGGPAPLTYCHPYDFDTEERYWPVPDAGRLAPLLWVGRRRALAKMDRLLASGAGLPLRDRIADAVAGGVFGPATSVAPATVGAGAAATATSPRDRAEQR